MKPRGSQFSEIKMHTEDPSQPGFQYPMFRPAGALRGPGGGLEGEAKFNPSDLHDIGYNYGYETDDEGWDRKADEARMSGLTDRIASEGVRNPVLLSDKPDETTSHVMNGHHRIAAAEEIDPNMEVPVAYGNYWPGDDLGAAPLRNRSERTNYRNRMDMYRRNNIPVPESFKPPKGVGLG